jgi:hypothetical protein
MVGGPWELVDHMLFDLKADEKIMVLAQGADAMVKYCTDPFSGSPLAIT